MVDTLSRMRQLIGTTAQWSANNIVLGDGEIGVEVIDTNTRRMKIGDGTRTWSTLPYTSITQGSLDAEAAARAAADATLTTNLTAEQNARIAADNAEATTRATNDTTEVNARIAAINAEASTRGTADTTLQTNITNETNARIAADTAEATTRGNADNALDARIDVLEAGAGSDDGRLDTLEANLAAETAARMTADAGEVTARSAADTTLQTNINTEATTRAAADTAEATTRAAADQGLDARLDTIEGQNLDARVDELETQISLVPPPWVPKQIVGGVEKLARCYVNFPSGQYWLDGVRSLDYLINYYAASEKLYCDDLGKFRIAPPNVPVITMLGLMFWRQLTAIVKYNRDPRVNWRVSVTGMSGGEFFTDGEPVTTSAGGAGIYIAGESPIVLLGNWTGAAPANGQTLTGANAIASISTSVTPAWVHNNVTVTKDQVGLLGEANGACRVTATAPNASLLQPITAASTTRRSCMFLRRLVGIGEVALTTNGGGVWDPRNVTSTLWARYSSEQITLANPSVGIRLAASGDSVAVDFVSALDRGPRQDECMLPGQVAGIGCGNLVPETKSTQITLADNHVWLKRSLPSFISDVTRFCVVSKFLPQIDNGGTILQLDSDGTSKTVAIQNYSTAGTASDNNHGVTHRTPANPSGFGNDPEDRKATPNLPHTVSWMMDANDQNDGTGNALCMIVADGSGARVNVAHPPSHYARNLQFVRIGMQWGYDLQMQDLAGYNHTTGFVTEFSIFEGAPSAAELEDMAPGSQLPTAP